jgi:hypothetical protein
MPSSAFPFFPFSIKKHTRKWINLHDRAKGQRKVRDGGKESKKRENRKKRLVYGLELWIWIFGFPILISFFLLYTAYWLILQQK